MKLALEDYLIKFRDKTSFCVELLESASVLTVQAWIDDHLSPNQLIEVRRVSVGDQAITDTDQFSEPVDADAFPGFERESSRADYLHQYEMEAV